MLFINADREYSEGRAQNYVLPEHVEKIVTTWQAFEDVDGFARVVTRDELRDNDDNLNIRRYADNAPSPEPQDVRAHLHGGIPGTEVGAKAELFAAHGFSPMSLADTKSKADPLDHRLVKRLLPEYLAELVELEATRVELEATVKGASGDEEDEDGGDESEKQLSEEELARLKKQLAASKRAVKQKKDDFERKLPDGRAALDEGTARELVLGILRSDLDGIIGRYMAAHRQLVVAAVENWWEKYRVTLTSIEQERDAAAERLRGWIHRCDHSELEAVGFELRNVPTTDC